MLTQAQSRATNELGDIRFEFPLTAPFMPQELLHASSDDFDVDEPFTTPLPTLTIASSICDSTYLEFPLTEPQSEPQSATQSPTDVAKLLPAYAPDSISEPIAQPETALPPTHCPDPLRTQTISAANQKVLRAQALQWKESGQFAVQPQQSQRQRLEDGFKHDIVALRERYILDGVLAVGGTGIVYKAHAASSESGNSTAVAIKTLRPEFRTDVDAIQRLKQEFRYTTALKHPNIVSHLGIEQSAGTWFITMALLSGRSLASLLNDSKAKPLSIEEALIILKGCYAALSFAHLHGIVHCDLKPSNVWVTNTGEVLLIDFGAAQLYTASSSALKNTSASERQLPRLATPAYASPQVLAGQPAEPRDDIYSLTCMAYELLGERFPFGHKSVVEAITTGAVQRDMPIEHLQSTAITQAPHDGPHNNIDASFDPVITDRQVSALPRNLILNSQQMPQALLPRPVLQQQPQSSIELPSVDAQRNTQFITDLASRSVQNEWLVSARSPLSFHSQSATANCGPIQSKPISLPVWLPYRRNAAAICIALAVISIVVIYRWSGLETSSDTVTKKDLLSTPIQVQQPVPVMLIGPTLTGTDTSNADSPISNRPAWQTFTVNRQSNAHWRIGVDLLPGTINPYTSLATTRVTAAPNTRITLDQQTVTVSDRAAFAVLLLNRSGSRRDSATIHWRTIAGSAKPGVDYQDEPSGIARFADNQSTRAVYVQLKQNNNSLDTRSFAVELSRPSANAAMGKISRAVITIHASNQ